MWVICAPICCFQCCIFDSPNRAEVANRCEINDISPNKKICCCNCCTMIQTCNETRRSRQVPNSLKPRQEEMIGL